MGGTIKKLVALLAEGVDRNPRLDASLPALYASPSSRRAWIEIHKLPMLCELWKVALLAEGVDRNISCDACPMITKSVALLAEGVDRNIFLLWTSTVTEMSPSSRRAWIEI